MVIIDSHCHLSNRFGSGPASWLIESLDGAGVDKACVFSDNKFVEKAVEEYPDRFIPFVYFDPRYEESDLDEVDSYVGEKGWKGIKVGHQFPVARSMYPMMEKAESYGALVVIHSDHTPKDHPYIIGDIANSFPKVNTVIFHMGSGVILDSELVSIKIAEKNPNVYLETSYSHPYAIKKSVETLGADRVMFGSDASNGGYGLYYDNPADYIDVHLDAVRLCNLPKEEEDMVMCGTIAKLLEVDL